MMGRRAVAGSALPVMLSLVIPAVMTAGTTLALIRLLDRREYGLFALALSLHQVWIIVFDLGLTSSAAREVARSVRDKGALREVMGSAVTVKVAASLAAGLLLAVAAPLIAALYQLGDLGGVLGVTGAALAACSLFQLPRHALNALGHRWRMLLLMVVESVLEVAACLALVLALDSALGAMAGRVIAYGLGAILGLCLLRAAVGRLRRPSRHVAKAIVRGGPLNGIAEGLYVAYLQSGVLLVGALLGPVDVAHFEAPLRLLTVAGFIGSAFGLAIGPGMSLAEERERAGAHLAFAVRAVCWLQGALIIPWVALVAPEATLLFGEGYAASERVLLLLTPLFFVAAVSPVFSFAALYGGIDRRRVAASAVALVTTVVPAVPAIALAGIDGAAAATSLGAVVFLTYLVVISAPLLRLTPRRVATGVATPLVLGGLVAVAAALAPAESLAGRLAAAAAGVVLFAGVAAVLARRLARGDLRRLRGAPIQLRPASPDPSS